MGNLSAFMKKEFVNRDIAIEIPGFDRFTDENGKPVMFKVRKLTYEHIQKIRRFYSTERIAYDKKTKKPVVSDGVLVKEVKTNNDKATANIVVEALVYPNLKDKELMDFYGCDEYIAMPTKVFDPIEYTELVRRIWIVLGLIKPDEDDEEDDEGSERDDDYKSDIEKKVDEVKN